MLFRSWACGSCPLSFADWIKLLGAAARLPLRNDPVKSQFLHPGAQGLIWFSHMSFNVEYARCVVEVFTDVFADALERTAASALGVLGFVV